MTMLQLTEC